MDSDHLRSNRNSSTRFFPRQHWKVPFHSVSSVQFDCCCHLEKSEGMARLKTSSSDGRAWLGLHQLWVHGCPWRDYLDCLDLKLVEKPMFALQRQVCFSSTTIFSLQKHRCFLRSFFLWIYMEFSMGLDLMPSQP